MSTSAAEQHPPDTATTLQQKEYVVDVGDPSHPLHLHRRTVSDFDYGEAIGEGSYSTVMVARDKKTNKQYAIKKLDKAHIVKNDKVKYVMIERNALSRMNHPGIVKLYWTFKDNRSLYYVLDLAPLGELYTFIRKMAPLDIDTTRYYASQILVALDHIHSKEVVHRDIKTENILLDDQMHIKITDFGSAKLLFEDTVNQVSGARSFVGTAEFVSPELLRSDPTHKEADWWAFGCIIFQMLSGQSPFKAATDYLIFQKIKNLDYEFPDDFPDVAKDLIQQLLVLDSGERLGSDSKGGVDSIKAHCFFQDVDFENIFHQSAPPKAQQYLEDWKLQQAQRELNKEKDNGFDSDDEDEFGTWFNGNGSIEIQHVLPQQFRHEPSQHQQEQLYRHIPITNMQPTLDVGTDSHLLATVATLPPDVTIPTQSTLFSSTGLVSTPYEPKPATNYYPSSPNKETSPANYSKNLPIFPTQTEVQGTQVNHSSIAHLHPSEFIVRAGKVGRRRGLFTKKRYLILTDKPRLLYLNEGQEPDGSGGALRCEIDWTPRLLPELKGSTSFSLYTPEKSYTFDVAKDQAEDWINAINTSLVNSFGSVSV